MSIVGGNSPPTGPIMKEIKLLLMKLSFSSIGLMIFLESLTSGDRTIESCPLSDGHGVSPAGWRPGSLHLESSLVGAKSYRRKAQIRLWEIPAQAARGYRISASFDVMLAILHLLAPVVTNLFRSRPARGAQARPGWGEATFHYAAAATAVPLKTRPSRPAVIFTFSPSLMRPASSSSASGSCTERWITRFNGRAP
jgi:hypothetical protein